MPREPSIRSTPRLAVWGGDGRKCFRLMRVHPTVPGESTCGSRSALPYRPRSMMAVAGVPKIMQR